MENVKLFKKVVKTNDGKEFDTFFVRLNKSGLCFSARLSNKFKEMIIKKDVSFPIELDLDVNKNDYFLIDEDYDNEDGITLTKKVVVLQNCQDMKHYNMPSMSLTELEESLSK